MRWLLSILLCLSASAQIPRRLMLDELRAATTPASSALPSGLMLQFESSSFSVANGTAISSWTELTHGWNAVTTNGVGYVTNSFFSAQPALVLTNIASSTAGLMVSNAAYGVLSNVAGATVFCVAKNKYTDTSAQYHPIITIMSGSAGNFRLFLGTSTVSGQKDLGIRVRRTDLESGVNVATPPGQSTNTILGCARVDYTGGKAELWTNGVACATNNLASSGNTSQTASKIIGIGADAADSGFEGWIGAVLVWARYLTDAERSSVEGYLKNKYATP